MATIYIQPNIIEKQVIITCGYIINNTRQPIKSIIVEPNILNSNIISQEVVYCIDSLLKSLYEGIVK